MLSLSFERSRNWSRQGLSTVSILVPGDNVTSPFDTDVIVNRYPNELPVLFVSNTRHSRSFKK
jgi:hypothetical protein